LKANQKQNSQFLLDAVNGWWRATVVATTPPAAMKNLFLIVQLKNDDYRYDQWRADFDAEADAHKLFMRGVTIGKIDDHTAMVAAEIFDKPGRDAYLAATAERSAALGIKNQSYVMIQISAD
jgi:hypothetical protein